MTDIFKRVEATVAEAVALGIRMRCANSCKQTTSFTEKQCRACGMPFAARVNTSKEGKEQKAPPPTPPPSATAKAVLEEEERKRQKKLAMAEYDKQEAHKTGTEIEAAADALHDFVQSSSPRKQPTSPRLEKAATAGAGCAACVKQKRVCEGGFVAAPFKKNQCANCQHSSAEHADAAASDKPEKTEIPKGKEQSASQLPSLSPRKSDASPPKEQSASQLPAVSPRKMDSPQKEQSASQLPSLSPRKSDQPAGLAKEPSQAKVEIPKKSEAGTIRKGEADDPSKNPRAAIACLESNDASFVSMQFHNNTSFAMKHAELTGLVATALSKNTHLERLELVKCDLDHRDAIQLAGALAHNSTLRVLNLQNNKISNEGATALANALRNNQSVTELNLLGQQQAAFGEPCLQCFIDMFDYNVTLTKIIWRLDSRKSFAINKLIVRNNTIKKWLQEGKSVADIYPKNANISTGDLKTRLGDRMSGASSLDVEVGADDDNWDESTGPEAARQSQGGGLAECPPGANAAAKATYNDFVTRVDKKWKALTLPLVAGASAAEGEKILAAMAALRPKVEAAAIPDLTARFRELNRVIPHAVNEANAAANSKASKLVCEKCKTQMTGAGCEVSGKHYHKSCWKCESCKAPLVGKPIVVTEKLYCDDCGRIAFSKQAMKK